MQTIHKQILFGSTLSTVTLLICFFILRDTRQTALQKELHSRIGYKFNFRDHVQLIHGDRSLLDRPYKILIYTDDRGCTSCNLKLREWSDMYETLFNRIVPGKLSVVILFDGREAEDMLALVRNAHWEMPVLWDRDGEINSRRPFPKQVGMRCMLLDEEDRVLLVGNPFYSSSVSDLYLQTLVHSRYDETF